MAPFVSATLAHAPAYVPASGLTKARFYLSFRAAEHYARAAPHFFARRIFIAREVLDCPRAAQGYTPGWHIKDTIDSQRDNTAYTEVRAPYTRKATSYINNLYPRGYEARRSGYL